MSLRDGVSRSPASLQLDDGLVTHIPRKIAFQLIEVGELILIKEQPLTVRIPKHKEFQEEQRHLSGRRVPGISKGLFNGRYSTSSGLRVRPPRSAQSRDYLVTIGMVRERQREILAEQEKVKDELEKARRRKRKRKRRKMRRKS